MTEAARALLYGRIRLSRLGPAALVRGLQSAGHGSEAPPNTTTRQCIDQIEFAIRGAAVALPWRTDCLVRCLAAKDMLDRRGLPSEFYIGVQRKDDGSLAAHAWMRCYGIPVAGGDGSGFAALIAPEQEVG